MPDFPKKAAPNEIKCVPTTGEVKCATACKLEALLSIDDRGQMILPKELREKAEIKPGDKLALVTCEKEGKICCITMIKAEEIKEGIKKAFGPLLEELLR